jgi:hypothetical protein
MKTKCQIIPASIYDNLPPVVFEDDKWRYILGNSGHLIRLRKKTCSICPISMSYVVIFEYAKHNRVERFCSQHASEFGELPPIPEIPLSEITDKQRRKIPQISTEAIRKWNMQIKI